ncbi:helix-turn-helix domain-containing protein [Microtetraspora niveoalba]|uniref:helix-turn-helix domain-containing protein n=1 Tax=Microtetraspora niveoalba TaxID=46175 RepID=UPI0008323F15|nr:helix-turn-helix transcriptional regulator [Microtetraspora niveoalba]
MDVESELSQFLKSRRARLRPEQVGLPSYGRQRRVPGLRREELAQLAGVSVTHYTRLEQGQRRNVSAEILDAIATALHLTADERAHLHRLARPGSLDESGTNESSSVSPSLLGLLNSMVLTGAALMGRRTELLAWNPLLDELMGGLDAPPSRRTVSHWLFFNEAARQRWGDSWERLSRANVAYLRTGLARYPHDERLRGHIAAMRVQSPDFERMWQAYEVEEWSSGGENLVLHHPLVGPVELDYRRVLLPDDPHVRGLLLYSARPGTTSHERMRHLASLSTPGLRFT